MDVDANPIIVINVVAQCIRTNLLAAERNFGNQEISDFYASLHVNT